MPLSAFRESLVAVVLLAASGCGASSYLVAPGASYASGPIAAQRGDSDAAVLVRGEKLAFAQAVPIDAVHVRVRPRRPLGLVVTGAVSLGVGLAFLGGALGKMFTPRAPGVLDEDWATPTALLTLGSSQSLVGIILLSVGGARWSPEVAR